MPPRKHAYSPQELALSEERKRKKAEAAARRAQVTQQKKVFLSRAWLTPDATGDAQFASSDKATIMTWNMLSQNLVRRELFPNSNCLKAAVREGMLHEEITKSGADVICLQEVDRLEKLVPVLEGAGYAHTFACGPRKKHGCMIAYRKDMFVKSNEKTVFYDEVEVRSQGVSEQARIGSSFKTKNIGLIVSLTRQDAEASHIVVATTHLFWHPKYTYERARQTYILIQSIEKFKNDHGLQDAVSFIAGDFNFEPSNAAYSLLAGDPLTPQQEQDISSSHVVHATIDPTIPKEDSKLAEEEEGGEADPENDPDRVIKNARRATTDDGLLDARELEKLFAQQLSGVELKSVYDNYTAFAKERTFSARNEIPLERRGRNEPIYTSYTYYWKVTLDYIFVLLPPSHSLNVLGILEPPKPEDLGDGLPQKGICGSDHVALRAQIAWPKAS